jgi:hypothetical protein
MLVVLLLTACSSESDTTETKQPPVINIYVYAPDKPIITRGNIGEVDPINNDESESKITSLQIWVFEHNTDNLISYHSPESVTNLNNGTGATYQLSASNAFTDAETKPKVDVYVVANVTAANTGITLGERITRTALEAALISGDYFGLNTLTKKVPDAGLPMSGVLRGVSVTGSAPVYKISNVTLTRTVSKIRFVFSREKVESETDANKVKINSIKLGAEMIPTQEYLFLETGENAPAFHVGSYGTDDAKEFLPIVENQVQALPDIAQNEDPMAYSYQAGQDAQEYEDLIETGLNKTPAPELTQVGPFYLRESGKQLTGTITFQKNDGTSEEKTVPFAMHIAGDFSRNHTWIVYAYYSASGLVAVTVVVKDWNDVQQSYEVVNW